MQAVPVKLVLGRPARGLMYHAVTGALHVEQREARRFYRVVATNPPTEDDFKSYEALGKPLRSQRPTAGELASWRAVATYVTENLARKRAVQNAAVGLPLGDFIARLEIAEGATVVIGEVNDRTGHCNLTGAPAELLRSVVSVVGV